MTLRQTLSLTRNENIFKQGNRAKPFNGPISVYFSVVNFTLITRSSSFKQYSLIRQKINHVFIHLFWHFKAHLRRTAPIWVKVIVQKPGNANIKITVLSLFVRWIFEKARTHLFLCVVEVYTFLFGFLRLIKIKLITCTLNSTYKHR